MILDIFKYQIWPIFVFVLFRIEDCDAQCNGSPLFILPNNNTGNLAFPESNLDPLTGAWTRDNRYPLSVSCTWVLKAPPLHVIYLKILSFNTEEQFDFITFYSSVSRKEELFKFSGNLQTFYDIFSPDNTLVIDFVSDDYTNYDGFHFAYMYLPQACVTGGVSITENQLIALPPWNLQGALPGPKRPGFEAPSTGVEIPLLQEIYEPSPRWLSVSPYPQGLNCSWHLAVPQKHLLQIDILQFDTDLDDVLQIWKIGESGLRPLFKILGSEVPTNQIKSSDPILLNFVSGVDERGSNSGFLLNVTYVSRGCSPTRQEYMSPSSFIGYPSHNLRTDKWLTENAISYGPDYCEWILKAPDGYVFNISVLHVDLRDEDFVQITENGKDLLKISGNSDGPIHTISETNFVRIEFTSTSETEKTGFLIHFSWYLKDCNFQLTESEGEVRSPFYPEVYGMPLECSWRIKTIPLVIVHVLVSRLRLDEGDFLQVTDGTKTVLFSSTSVNPDLMEFFPTTDALVVNFLSNKENNKGYFLLKYNAFEPGNCNFSITTCGWTSKDPIRIWEFKERDHIVSLEEKSKIGFHLPRGYRSHFASPVIYPREGHSDACFQFQYLLVGQDAYKLSVGVAEFSEQQVSAFLSDESLLDPFKSEVFKKSLLEFHGSQGDLFLKARANITVNKPLQIIVSYERGYGPHYKVSLREMQLTNHQCQSQGGSNGLPSLSCQFRGTFCAWKNTHKDHQNWEIGDHGVTSPIDENMEISLQRKLKAAQYADLISPILDASSYQEKNATEACLNLSYKIHSPFSELKVFVHSDGSTASGFNFRGRGSLEEEIWGQGRISSPKILQAQIPLMLDALPATFQIILRASSSHSAVPTNIKWSEATEFGVSVYSIDLHSGTCSNTHECDFDSGFCSWRIISTGNSVWHVKEVENERFAAFSSNGIRGDLSQMMSSTISANTQQFLSFRYLIKDTNQCIKIATIPSTATPFSKAKNTPSLNIIWEQCKDKGDHWLNECVDLPQYETFYKIIIASGTGPENSKIWLDDLNILPGRCNPGNPGEEITPKRVSWSCRPESSLCGMMQPPPGNWDWSYYHINNNNNERENPGNVHLDIDNNRNENNRFSNIEYRNELSPYNSIEDSHNDEAFSSTLLGLYDNDFNDNIDKNNNKGKPLNFANDKRYHPNAADDDDRIICSDGNVIDPSWACDGIPDCDDGTDEKDCDCGPDGCGEFEESTDVKEKCKDGYFLCPSGRRCPKEGGCSEDFKECLPQSFLCDGEIHCKNGEDEHVCNLKDEGWQSDDPKVIKKRQATLMYEKFGLGSSEMDRGLFECSGGLVIPVSLLCDGRKDCPLDGLDEVGCLQCDSDEFLCPKTGFCLPKALVCDGELSIETCTDEVACLQCEPGFFACDICLPSMKICDGVWDCSMGEDETRCRDLSYNNYLLSDSSFSTGMELPGPGLPVPNQFAKCNEHQFSCSNGKCMPLSSVCDRQMDCLTGDDEFKCNDDNIEEEYYVTATPSVVHDTEPWSYLPSYLTTPVLHQDSDSIGVLSFRYRMDSWIGISNVTLCIELLNPNDTRISLTPWSLWRQAGNKGKLWLSDYIVIPGLPDIKEYKIGFLISGEALQHRSQQIHLSKISFKNTDKKNLQELAKQWSFCEFTDNWCGWTQPYTEGGYSWVHAMTSPHARRTGPITGHPDNEYSGFIFADSLLGEEGEAVDLLSPILQLETEEQILCFRFATFLYGANIGQLSLHIMQVTSSGHSFTKELFNANGSKGLSWIPVTITIDKSTLKEPTSPFLIVFRAIKGNGPEADIAIDHFSITEGGSCESDTKMNENFILLPLTSASFSHIRALKAGLSFTTFLHKSISEESPQGSTNYVNDNVTATFDLCSLFKTCVDCVLSSIEECNWCTKTYTCASPLSSQTRMCPSHHIVHGNLTEEVKAGPMWCPRLAPEQPKETVIPSDSVISLSFPVTNIQSSHTKSDWLCIFTTENENEMSKISEIRKTDTNDVSDEEEHKLSSEDEDLWNRLKKYALDRKTERRVIKVPGVFQGTVYRSSLSDEASPEVGVGAIKCGDEETLLKIPEGATSSKIKIEIRTPDGGILDNPDNVYVSAYRCDEIASDCTSCMNLNNTYPCGWCSFTHSCTSHVQCVNGMWQSHSDSASHVCSVQEELNFIKSLLESDDSEGDLGAFDDEDLIGEELSFIFPKKKKKGGKKNIKNLMKKSLAENRNNRFGKDDEEIFEEIEENKNKNNENNNERGKSINKKRSRNKAEKVSGKAGSKGSLKLGKKTRGKGFLKVPIQNGVFIARDVWRLHTGRQYYVPVTKKTLINLGFVRHVNYGRLAEEKSRTLLMDGAWKKAAGFFIDLYEKAGQDPMTSIITTNKDTFEKILGQLLPESN